MLAIKQRHYVSSTPSSIICSLRAESFHRFTLRTIAHCFFAFGTEVCDLRHTSRLGGLQISTCGLTQSVEFKKGEIYRSHSCLWRVWTDFGGDP